MNKAMQFLTDVCNKREELEQDTNRDLDNIRTYLLSELKRYKYIV